MKCTISKQLITICMALLCIMSSISLKINVDEKIETKVSESLEKTSGGPDKIYYVADDNVCGFSIKYKGKTEYTPIPYNANAPFGEVQTHDLTLKRGDEIKICVKKKCTNLTCSGYPAMFACTIKYNSPFNSVTNTPCILFR